MPTIHHLYNRSFFRNKPAPPLNIPGFMETFGPQELPLADCLVIHVPSILLTHRPDELHDLRKIVPKRQIWVAQSYESAVNYPALDDPGFMALFNLEMSYRQTADIWTPYIPGQLLQQSVECTIPARRRLCCAFVSSHADESGRQAYIRDLMRNLTVHSYGKFMRNKRVIIDRGTRTKLRILKKYRFALAFENAIETDYVTEKFFEPLITGAIPVYLGAPNIEQFAPGENCFVNANAFSSPVALAGFLRDADPSHFHQWRTQPLRADFRNRTKRLETAKQLELSRQLGQMLEQS